MHMYEEEEDGRRHGRWDGGRDDGVTDGWVVWCNPPKFSESHCDTGACALPQIDYEALFGCAVHFSGRALEELWGFKKVCVKRFVCFAGP